MTYSINDTSSYHRKDIDSLDWELTICNALEPADTPYRSVLKNNNNFGYHLFKMLKKYIPLDKVSNIIEIGGGYGYLMRDFLTDHPESRASMLDISGFLLNKQRKTLSTLDKKIYSSIQFIEKDFFLYGSELLKSFDMTMLNENAGDFPVSTEIPFSLLNNDNLEDPHGRKIAGLINKYRLDIAAAAGNTFSFNTGAAEAVEKLCLAGVKYIYLSEHSCEAETPAVYSDIVKIKPSGSPGKISLRGHDEYTVKFSHLRKIGEYFNYKSIRGSYVDFIEVDFNERINFIMKSNSSKEGHEEIRYFIEDLFKYEYLILVRE